MTHEVGELSRNLVGVIGLELDDGSTSYSHHWCNKSCIGVPNSSAVMLALTSTAILFGHVGPSRYCFKPVTLFDQLPYAEDR